MNTFSQDAMLQAWKQQLDAGFRVIEALTEGVERLREAQLDAVTEAHADAVATQRAVAGAKEPAELLRLQAEWMRGSSARAIGLWRCVLENSVQTGAQLASCLAPAEKAK